MARGKKSGIPLSKVINPAIEEGIESIIEEHPRLEGFEEFLSSKIDKRRLLKDFEFLKEKAEEKGLRGKKAIEYIYEELADYISSAQAFNREGKNVIIGNNLEEKARGWLGEWIRNLFHKPRFDGERYLDRVIGAASDLNLLLQSGDYEKRMPELVESVRTLNDFKFLNPSLDSFRSRGIIDEQKYKFLKEKVYSAAKEHGGGMIKGVENYIEKLAAAILGTLGLGLVLLSSTKITGMAVGNLSKLSLGIIGAFLILFSLILLFKKSKKKI